MSYRSPLKTSSQIKSVQSAISGQPQSGRITPEEGIVSSGTEVEDLLTQIAALQSQVNQLQAQAAVDAATIASLQGQITNLQGQVASLQAQVAADAITIAGLQAQVVSLQAQVASLQAQVNALSNPLYKRFVVATISLIDGGVYVPPIYDNPVISVFRITPIRRIFTITTTGGGYP